MKVDNVNSGIAASSSFEDAVEDMLQFVKNRATEAESDPKGLAVEVNLLADVGLLKKCFARQNGGEGLAANPEKTRKTFKLLRRMGRANLALGRLFEGHLNAVKLLELYGTPALIDRAMHRVSSGGLLGVWGADGKIPLRYAQTAQDITLTGQKSFASGLGLVCLAVVTLRAFDREDGFTRLALVDVSDARRQDASTWTATGMRATHSGTYDFSEERITQDQFLGQPGDYAREPFFEGGVWRYCALHLGGAEAILTSWRAALRARDRLGDSFQLARFARAVALSRAMASLLRDTAERVETASVENEGAIQQAVSSALLARQFTEEACVDIMASAEKSLGTLAFMTGEIDRLRRDLSLFIRQAGLDDKLLKAAKWLNQENEALSW